MSAPSLFLVLLLALQMSGCVENTNSKRKVVVTPTPGMTNPLIGCSSYQPVCALMLVDNGQELNCIQPGPGCGESVPAYAKVNFYNRCAAEQNNAHVLHNGKCADVCALGMPAPDPSFCSGPNQQVYYDYGDSGCVNVAKCRDFPCPMMAVLPYVEPCASGQAHKVFSYSQGCGTGFSCQPSTCPRSDPMPLPTNCPNTGQFNASYKVDGCLHALTCAN